MTKIFSFETGRKINDDEIAKIIDSQISVKSITPEEQKEIIKKSKKMAEAGMKSLEKSMEELRKNSQEKLEK